VVAIDGPSGAGKGTVARLLAQALGFQYLDTGALYRAVALGLRKRGVSPSDPDETISQALKGITIELRGESVLLDGEDVSEAIRTKEAGHYSSVFSARRPVREFLLPLQRKMAQEHDLVAEGRDTTTVVFPRAWRKFYLDASPQERARRRYQQLLQAGLKISLQDALEDVLRRDERDSSRALAPLRKSPDAIYIDTTRLSPQQVVRLMLKHIRGSHVQAD
jgi:cytidylate kinase